ncbi:MAG: sugar ABC transporter substrate-binding protein [Candidatus Atribacteria bacterium]|nr:sugar ABC transporter substrate-binding protein [Candidatus Atribacteria bacterium]
MNKKIVLGIVMLSLCFALLLNMTGIASAEEGKVRLGVCMSTFTSPYASAMVKTFKSYCQEKGYDLVILDAQLDIQKEANNIDDLMAKKVNAIMVNAVDSEGSRAALKKAADAGFVVICSNTTVNNPQELGIRAYTGPNCYDEAVTAAKDAIKRNPKANVVMITGTPGYSAAIDREKGFTDTIAKEAPEMKMLDIQTANWMREDTQRVMSDYITKYGDKINIVYVHDDNMTVGAVNALKAAGYTLETKPIIISVGAMADGLPLIKEGWIDSSMMQSPITDAQLAVDTAVDIMNGKQTEKYKDYFMATPPVDKSNVQKVIDMHIWD